MTCVLEVYDICKQRGTSMVVVHTNLGYIHYHDDPSVLKYTGSDWRGLLKVIAWQLWPIVWSKVSRKARYDSWLRDGPPECIQETPECPQCHRLHWPVGGGPNHRCENPDCDGCGEWVVATENLGIIDVCDRCRYLALVLLKARKDTEAAAKRRGQEGNPS